MKNKLAIAIAMCASLASFSVMAQSGDMSPVNPGGGGVTNGNGMGNGGTGVSHEGGGHRNDTFRELDRGHKGYLTRRDVRSDPPIFHHFRACDRNHNGKLSRSEFRMCKRKYEQ